MKLLLVFARRYPRRTAFTVLCLLAAGLVEGVGVSSVLPLIRLALPAASAAAAGPTNSQVEQYILRFLQALGLPLTAPSLLGMVLTGILLKAALILVAHRQVGYTVAHVATGLRLDLIRALLATRWQYYIHQPMGTVANAVALEAQSASEAYQRALIIVAFSIQAVIYATVAFFVSPQATLAALAGGAAIVFLLNHLVRMARRAGARQTKLTRSLLGRMLDALQAMKPLKAMARESLIAPILEGETRRLNHALEREATSAAALDALQEPLLFVFLVTALYVALTWFGMPLANVLVLVFLCAKVLGGVGRVQKEMQKIAAREHAFWALRGLIQQAEGAVEHLPGGRIPTLRDTIRLVGVGFAYEEKWVLRNADLIIPAGALTVITGPSGSGKTTVADLIIGLLQPAAGQVLVDDVPLTEIDLRRFRSLIGYVPQETLMLHESVAYNVSLGDPEVSVDDVAAALRAAGAWEFVAALPEGVDTLVGERGLRISGGQRQRLALARALVRQPKLLILDEATTALDPDTERDICETLYRLRGIMTLIAICHHGHLIDIADVVYRVDHGRVEPVTAAADTRRVASEG